MTNSFLPCRSHCLLNNDNSRIYHGLDQHLYNAMVEQHIRECCLKYVDYSFTVSARKQIFLLRNSKLAPKITRNRNMSLWSYCTAVSSSLSCGYWTGEGKLNKGSLKNIFRRSFYKENWIFKIQCMVKLDPLPKKSWRNFFVWFTMVGIFWRGRNVSVHPPGFPECLRKVLLFSFHRRTGHEVINKG
jgi:hypothetical protein